MNAEEALPVALSGLPSPAGPDVASLRRRAEEFVLLSSYERAREDLVKIQRILLETPHSELDLMALNQRIQEVSELATLSDARLREHLERGQFYFNNLEYAQA